MKNWLKAAERYEAAKQPEFKARKKRSEPDKASPSFAAFMANGEGAAAQKLLAASGHKICLGYSETVMSRAMAVIIDGEGLKTHSGLVGMAAAYTKEKPEQKPIDAAKALELLKSFPEEGNLLEDHFEEGTLINNLRQRLDSIATEAP
jgi:hypothetical protein